jgi:hypothetical protein
VRDIWSHVKIPRLSHTSTSEEDSEGWRPVNIRSLDDYSSLFGLQVEKYAYSKSQSLDFTVESWYWDLACGRLANVSTKPAERFVLNSTYSRAGYGSVLKVSYNVSGKSSENVYDDVARPMCISDFTYQNGNDSAGCAQLPARIFRATIPYQQVMNLCEISTKYVETHITCADGECVPKRMRQSRKSHPHRNWTMFDYQQVGSSATKQEAFWNNLVRALVNKAFTSVDTLIGYIVQPAQLFFASGFLDPRVDDFDIRMPSLRGMDDALTTSRFT